VRPSHAYCNGDAIEKVNAETVVNQSEEGFVIMGETEKLKKRVR